MRLKHIKLVGFKSFVDATTVPFPQQMTAIVGPNGCGKSNVIDAVRWVLGESSAKNLRGDAMTDVIFNGSTNRKPVSQASVELLFDNTEGRLQGQMADRSEISVKRQVTKDATSTYFLNGTKCRRRDITDIFLGTGLGPRSYAIIEQGMISRLIESKPQELRVFLEEAAGISKYKERRRETENRIKHTRENLERLADVREELGTQLEKLKRQAATARRYKDLKQQERQYKAELHALKWHKYNEQFSIHEQQKRKQETELESFIAEQRGGELGLINLKDQLTAINAEIQNAQQDVYQAGNQITRLEQQIVFEQERKQQTAEQQQQLSASIATASELIEQEQGALEDLQEQHLQQVPEHELLYAQLEQAQEQQLTIEEQHDAQQNSISERVKAVGQAEQQVKIIETRLHHSQQAISDTSQRQQSIRQQQNDAQRQFEEYQAQLAEQANKLESMQAERAILIAEQDKATQAVEECEAAILIADKQRQQAEQTRQQTRFELQQHQQWHDKWQAQITSANDDPAAIDNSQYQPVIAQLNVNGKWKLAVERLLAHHGQPLLVSTLPLDYSGRLSSQYVRAGSCHREQAVKGSLASVIIEGDYPSWFNRVAVADTIDQAQQHLADSNSWMCAVLPSGEWIGTNWLGNGTGNGSDSLGDSDGSIFEKLEALSALTQQNEHNNEQCAVFEKEWTTLQSSLEEAKQQQKSVQALHTAKATEAQQCEMEAKLIQHKVEQKQQELHRLQTEQLDLDEQHDTLLLAKEAIAEELLLSQEQLDERQQHAQQSESAKELVVEQLQSIKAQVNSLTQTYQQQQLKLQALQSQIENASNNLQRAKQQYLDMQSKLDELKRGQQDDEATLILKEQLEEQLQQQLESEQQLQEQHGKAADIADQIKTLELGQSGVMAKLDKMRDDIANVKMDSEGARVRAQSMLDVLTEMNVSLKDLLDNMPDEAEEQAWTVALEKTTAAVQRLGAINLAAIEEYDIQAERKGYLDDQYNDLTSALETLEAAIRKIDRESRAKFKDTYDQVNEGLQTLFPKVFGGGAAYLELTGDDLLETGVTIMARPPGKKNSTIHLLSGGEKALTALSLVFSIFKLNPAPFCMLDEVDAPLDDANVGRFCKLVNEMSDTVQFIYISHNKVAMEMATHLTGVTMQEPGVSRLVAVDIQQAVEMAEAI